MWKGTEMTVVLNGSGLTIDKLARVARHGEHVELAPEALARIGTCRAMLEEKIQAHEIMYGVNTGIGEFSEIVLNDDQVKDFQKYLIYNHSAGIGDPAPAEYVRGAMVGRINIFRNTKPKSSPSAKTNAPRRSRDPPLSTRKVPYATERCSPMHRMFS